MFRSHRRTHQLDTANTAIARCGSGTVPLRMQRMHPSTQRPSTHCACLHRSSQTAPITQNYCKTCQRGTPCMQTTWRLRWKTCPRHSHLMAQPVPSSCSACREGMHCIRRKMPQPQRTCRQRKRRMEQQARLSCSAFQLDRVCSTKSSHLHQKKCPRCKHPTAAQAQMNCSAFLKYNANMPADQMCCRIPDHNQRIW